MASILISIGEKLASSVLSKVGGEAFSKGISFILKEQPDMAKISTMLNSIKSVLEDVNSRIDNVPAKTVFVNKWTLCREKADAILILLGVEKNGEKLTGDQVTQMCRFISESVNGEDYSSLATALLNSAYGITFHEFKSFQGDYFNVLDGQTKEYYVYGLNQLWLNKTIGFYDHIKKNVEVLNLVTAISIGLYVVAQKTYSALERISKRSDYKESIQKVVNEVIDNNQIKKRLFDEKENFLTDATNCLTNICRSKHICGRAYDLFDSINNDGEARMSFYSSKMDKEAKSKRYLVNQSDRGATITQNEVPGLKIKFADQNNYNKLTIQLYGDNRYLAVSAENQVHFRWEQFTWQLEVTNVKDYGFTYFIKTTNGNEVMIAPKPKDAQVNGVGLNSLNLANYMWEQQNGIELAIRRRDLNDDCYWTLDKYNATVPKHYEDVNNFAQAALKFWGMSLAASLEDLKKLNNR